ncbi:Uncharacterised protein [Mycobacteroides abscessus subsp. bolletii]|nr:Uncharacterised protein [Mycobacteroides abscessus subsp. bolletii]
MHPDHTVVSGCAGDRPIALGWGHADCVGADHQRCRSHREPGDGGGHGTRRRRAGRYPDRLPRGHHVPVWCAAGSGRPTGERPLGRRRPRRRRRSRSDRRRRDVHSRRRRPRSQHPAGHGSRCGHALQQDPPVRRVWLPRIGHRRARARAGSHHRRRGGRRADHVLRHPLPGAVHRPGAPRCPGDHGQCVLGRRHRQVGPVDTAGTGPGRGLDMLRSSGRPGLTSTGSTHSRLAHGDRRQPAGIADGRTHCPGRP